MNQKIIRFIVLVFTAMLACCCTDVPFYKDFHDGHYQIGMYVNGVEYHDRRPGFAPPFTNFFEGTHRIGSSVINIYFSGEVGPKDNREDTSNIRYIQMCMCVDSAQFQPSAKYYFTPTSVTVEDFPYYWYGEDYITETLLAGEITDEVRTSYRIKDGWLLLGDDIALSKDGDMAVYYRFKYSQFEFYAEDESGNGIVVPDGYCRRK